MASSIGQGGNYFSQINHQVAKGPDSKTAENLHHTGGTANTQRKTVVKKGVEQEEGFTFSDAARKSLQASHQEHIEGHEHELAAHAGLQELEPENTEDHELKTKRGHERDQEEKAEKAKAGATMLPDGAAPAVGKINETLVVKVDKPGLWGFKCKPHYTMGMVALVQVGAKPANLAAARAAKLPPIAQKRMTAMLAKVK